MAQREIWEDYDDESDTDVKYDFDSEEDAEEEDEGGTLDAGKPNRHSNYEDFLTSTTRKRRRHLIEVEPREPRKPIPTEEPRKTKERKEEQPTITEHEIEKREDDGKAVYEESDKDEETDDDEDEDEEEEEDYEEGDGDEDIIRPEDLEGPYPKETMTEEEHDALAEEIATMLGARDGTPDPDAFIPLDCTDGIKIGDERWNALMEQITKPHPYEEYIPKHHKTPAELIWEEWDRMDYNEGRYVDPDEFEDNDLTVPKDFDMEEIKKLATMLEEGKSLPDYYQ